MPARRRMHLPPDAFWTPSETDRVPPPDPDDLRELREEARIARADRLDDELKIESELRAERIEAEFDVLGDEAWS